MFLQPNIRGQIPVLIGILRAEEVLMPWFRATSILLQGSFLPESRPNRGKQHLLWLKNMRNQPLQGLHCTPEHCLVNGGVSLYFGGKSHIANGQDVSFKEPCRCMESLFRDPLRIPTHSEGFRLTQTKPAAQIHLFCLVSGKQRDLPPQKKGS